MQNIISNNNIHSMVALSALHHVIDPEIGLNIVDLGLVYQLDFDDAAQKIFISMTLTTQFCPMGDSIKDSAIHALQQAFPQYAINLELTFDPPWNAERISEEGQQYLNR